MPVSRRQWGAADRGMVHLVRLVLDDEWHPDTAGARLRELVGEPSVLRQMRGRVRRALADRPSTLAERAVLTVDAAAMEGQVA